MKSNIHVEVCRVAPTHRPRVEERSIEVMMTANGDLQISVDEVTGDILTLSRVECKTLWQVMKKFAESGNLDAFK